MKEKEIKIDLSEYPNEHEKFKTTINNEHEASHYNKLAARANYDDFEVRLRHNKVIRMLYVMSIGSNFAMFLILMVFLWVKL